MEEYNKVTLSKRPDPAEELDKVHAADETNYNKQNGVPIKHLFQM